MKTKACSLKILSLLFFLFLLYDNTLDAQSYNLNGYWQSDDRTCYQIRQNGNEVIWVKEDAATKRATNIFVGSIAGNILSGLWYDMPENSYKGFASSISLRVESNDRFVKIAESAQYAGSTWVRSDAGCNTSGVAVNRLKWSCVHEHVGCAVKNGYCGRYDQYPILFSSLNQGYVEASYELSGLTLKGTLSGNVYDFKYYRGGGQVGTGRFVFSPDMRSFEGTWDDPTGHKGTWTGRAPY